MNLTVQQVLVAITAVFLYATSAFALDVNRASVEELQNIKGVGPVLAKRIASERRKTKFKSMADLQSRVPGVGPKIAVSLSKGSGLPKGKAKAASSRSSKTAKAKVTEVGGKSKASKSSKKITKTKTKAKSTKKVAKASSKSASKSKKKSATKKLAKKVSNNKKK